MSYCFGLRSSNWTQSGAFQLTPQIFAEDSGLRRDRQPDIFGGAKLEDYQWSYLALLIIGPVVFAGPLLIFVLKLRALKRRGLLDYGSLGSEYTQAFHRRWIERSEPTEEPLLGSRDISSLASLGNSFEITRKMRTLPVEPSDFLAMVLPSLIPALPLAATLMPLGIPLGEILKSLLKLMA